MLGNYVKTCVESMAERRVNVEIIAAYLNHLVTLVNIDPLLPPEFENGVKLF
jgi:hypothetical protein